MSEQSKANQGQEVVKDELLDYLMNTTVICNFSENEIFRQIEDRYPQIRK